MKNSLDKLNEISDLTSRHQTYYSFNKDLDASKKYREGRVSASKWLCDLVYYFVEKESRFITEFKEHIKEQKKELSQLNNGDYKKGLIDELNLIEEIINDRNNK